VENYQPVNELYQTADHPALSPKSCGPEWRVAMAGKFGGIWITTWKTRQKYSPFDLRVGEGDACMRFGLAHFLNGYSFLMISPNLHDIWAMYFWILSRCGTLHFFTVVMAILCWAAKNSLRGTVILYRIAYRRSPATSAGPLTRKSIT
jgi:hypothetical protein